MNKVHRSLCNQAVLRSFIVNHFPWSIFNRRQQRNISYTSDHEYIMKKCPQELPIAGFAKLDRLTSGLQPVDLIIVAGRPSMEKLLLP